MDLTDQQKKVVNHNLGHARVLAIAGAGKTTTMVYRIKNLITAHNVNPKSIRVLMFNRKASEDFVKKARELITQQLPYISTFHSFSFQFIQSVINDGNLPKYSYWINEHEFEIDRHLFQIIKQFEEQNLIEKDKVELEEIKTCISLWKGSLIPPDRAGHKYSDDYVKVYKEFEERRVEQNALTYDDFIPLTVKILNENSFYKNRWANKLEHLIIDEYQDVNFGQQKLIEILAGDRANIMVVGDDDQTIYEWRGARPEYILKEFETTFSGKTHTIYKLDQTFRFGPLLAQYAQNSISLNSTRHPKNVIANKVRELTDISLEYSNPQRIYDTNESLSKTVIKLVTEERVRPPKIRVIARLYSQFSGIESWFIKHKIPYKIDGNVPFFKRREATILIDYAFLIENINSKISKEIFSSLNNILNTPNRKISKSKLELFYKRKKNSTLIELLDDYFEVDENIEQLNTFLIDGNVYYEDISKLPDYNISLLLEWIYENSKLKKHYLNYYGEGEQALNKINTTHGLIDFTSTLNFSPIELKSFIESLDSTRGLDDTRLIFMSTVHKTKGLEYDYVIIPDCIEGNMPYISDSQIVIFDKYSPQSMTKLSDSLESERRLFYVAITRGMKKVFIGTSDSDNTKSSRFLEEIIYSKTKSVLEPIVIGHINAEEWLPKLKNVLGKKNIVNNIKEYLNSDGQHEIRRMVEEASINYPEEEFSYARAYPIKQNKNDDEANNDNDYWDNLEAT